MQSQPQFADIDFEGSNVNVILDLLAANSQLNLFYEHMAMNESFLNSALLKSSVISKAKELGYTPRSARASKATVNIELTGVSGSPAGILVPRGTRFSGKGIDGNTYQFVNLEARTLVLDGGSYKVPNVEISEGKLFTVEYQYTGVEKTFRIPNANVDTTSMVVNVKTSAGTEFYTEFFRADSIIGLKQTSNAYYIQQSGKGEFEIYFSDGSVSAGLSHGNIVIIDYLVTNGEVANNVSVFTLGTQLYSLATQIVTTVLNSIGGSAMEGIESIRDNAKRSFVTQYRSVVATDYETNILADFPNVTSVITWGGEDAIPKSYGKVFCSVVTSDLLPITSFEKARIVTAIKKRNVINITPVITDPQVINIVLNGYVRLNRLMTSQPPESISAATLSKISTYNSTNLRKFGGAFQYSELSKAISLIDQSISGVVLDMTCNQAITLQLGLVSDYTVLFSTELRSGSISSSSFYTPNNIHAATLIDVNGQIFYKYESGSTNYLSAAIGSVNYTTGEVTLLATNLTPTDGTKLLTISATPAKAEMAPKFNQILNIDVNKTKLSVVSS